MKTATARARITARTSGGDRLKTAFKRLRLPVDFVDFVVIHLRPGAYCAKIKINPSLSGCCALSQRCLKLCNGQ
jgi:hypothetical protein